MTAIPPDAPCSLRDLIAVVADRGGVPAVSLPDATLTASDIGDLSRRGANVLADLGVETGDIVLTVCDNVVAQLAAWLGCIELGAVFAPLNTLLLGRPLAQIAAHSGARLLICQGRYLEQLNALREAMPNVTTVVPAGDCADGVR
ncbi:MAG: AMP-binding protein, partial [Candidatus Dormibacter sp.]